MTLKSIPTAKNPCQKSIHSEPSNLSFRLYFISLFLQIPRSPRSWQMSNAYLDSILPLGEMSRAFLRFQQCLLTLVLAQASSNGTGLLWSEVEGEVFLVLVEEAELRTLVGVDNCEDLGN
jgi:hypothetical protein